MNEANSERSKAKGMKQWELWKSIPLHEGKHSTRGLCFARWLKKETEGLSLDASQALLWSGALWLSVGVAILSKSENPSSFLFCQ